MLADQITLLGRALRHAGLPLDSARIAWGHQAAAWVGLQHREDVRAALEAVWVQQAADRWLFRDLFDAWFRPPGTGEGGVGEEGKEGAAPRYPHQRVVDALQTQADGGPPAGVTAPPEAADDGDTQTVGLQASERHRLQHADFRSLDAQEYRQVTSLARDIPLAMPRVAVRRTRPGTRGGRLHWSGAMHQAAHTGGELLRLPRLQQRQEVLPLLVLVDVSGSMERYARLLLAFLHAATRPLKRREVFAFGTALTHLTPAFAERDVDTMLAACAQRITTFAGGTRMGDALATLRLQHARTLVGRRTVVLLITDGLDTGTPTALAQEMAWLRRHSHRVLWLNPLLRFDGYTPAARGAAVLHAHAHAMLAVHNLHHLRQLAMSFARLLSR